METVTLGKIGLTLKGEYASGTYEKLDVVSYEGGSYASKIDDNTDVPTTENWIQMAEKGEIGDTGTIVSLRWCLSDTEINTLFPSPEVGDVMLVGTSSPLAIYRCEIAGTWTDTGQTFDIGSISLEDYAKSGGSTKTLQDIDDTLSDSTIPYTQLTADNVKEGYAYVGTSQTPSVYSIYNCFIPVFDISSIATGTLLYFLDEGGSSVFSGITWKFYDSTGAALTATAGGTTDVDRGYLVPEGATVLCVNVAVASFTAAQMAVWKLYGLPVTTSGLVSKVSSLEASLPTLVSSQETLESTVQNGKYEDAKKILFIGSSFGVDTISDVALLCQSFGKNVVLGNAYIGAATISTFLGRITAGTGVSYYKWNFGGSEWLQYNGATEKWSNDVDANITDEGETVSANDTVLMSFLLRDEAWDYIIIQNGAYQSPYSDGSAFWVKDTNGNITTNYVTELVNYCRKYCLYTNPVFGMNMTWAFSVYHTVSSAHTLDGYWVSFGETQAERQIQMWQNIANNYSACIENCDDIKFIVPSGTAIQNARTNETLRETTNYTSVSTGMPTIAEAEAITDLDGIEETYPFMDGTVNWTNKSDFTRDSIHANFGVSRYILGATLFATFMSKIYNLDISKCKYRIAQTTDGDFREQLATPVTDDNFDSLMEAVLAAIDSPFTVSSMI